LDIGGEGIWALIPVIRNDSLIGISGVLTKLERIKREMTAYMKRNGNYYISLKKTNFTGDTSTYCLGDTKASENSDEIIHQIPEGNWELIVKYGNEHFFTSFPYLYSIVGALVSLIMSLFAFSKLKEPIKLKREIRFQQKQLQERVKELTIISSLNELLKKEAESSESFFQSVAELLPGGWQYSNSCGVKIVWDRYEYTSELYKASKWKLDASNTLLDGKILKIEVVYLDDFPHEFEGPFLKEERYLLNNIIDTITIYLDKLTQKQILLDSEYRFRSAFENAAIGMGLLSLDGIWLKVNKSLCEMVGYSENELLGMNFIDITHPDDQEKDRHNLMLASEGAESSFRLEKRYIHKNGAVVWINLNVTLVRSNNGKAPYFVAQIENVSGKVESNLKFKNLVEKAPVGVYIIKNEKFVHVNPTMLNISGYTEDELLSCDLREFIHKDDVKLVFECLRSDYGEELDSGRCEFRGIKKNKEVIWLEVHGSVTIIDGEIAIIGTMVDITKQKKMIKDLIRSEANIRSIFDNSDVSYLLLDRKYKVLDYNYYLNEGIKDISSAEIKKGDVFIDLLPENNRKLIKEYCDKVIEGEETVRYESMYMVEDKPRYIYVTLSPIKSNDRVIGLCHAGIDITKMKLLELEREKMLNDLIQRNTELEQFNFILSHNIRSPLSTILGLSKLLEYNLSREEEQKAVQGMREWASKLDTIVKDLNEILNLKKQLQQSKAKINLNALVNVVKGDLSELIMSKAAKITFDFSIKSEIKSNQPFLHSIFLNLITNSIKYCKPNISPEIFIKSELKENKVVLIFEDNGIGIDMKKYGSDLFGLYKKFNFNEEGKGMGLFMVKTQVKSLGGTIDVQSEVDKGTRFIIELPL
ncbi:MAG: PAS domain S-box protein, partial [Bacteroidia bacterium]